MAYRTFRRSRTSVNLKRKTIDVTRALRHECDVLVRVGGHRGFSYCG